jgi:hypothetical protein
MEKLSTLKNSKFKSIDKFFIVPRNEIYFINFIIESYEIFGFVTTMDPYQAKIKVTISPFFIKDFEQLIEDIKKNVNIIEIK